MDSSQIQSKETHLRPWLIPLLRMSFTYPDGSCRTRPPSLPYAQTSHLQIQLRATLNNFFLAKKKSSIDKFLSDVSFHWPETLQLPVIPFPLLNAGRFFFLNRGERISLRKSFSIRQSQVQHFFSFFFNLCIIHFRVKTLYVVTVCSAAVLYLNGYTLADRLY